MDAWLAPDRSCDPRRDRHAPARDPRRAQFEANKLDQAPAAPGGRGHRRLLDDRGRRPRDGLPVRRQGQLRPARRPAGAAEARSPVPFTLVAVNLDQKQPGFPADVLPRYLAGRGVDFRIAEQDTYSVVKRLMPEGATMCSLCSRLRRGVLYRVAGELGATKIALGHHRDDLMATFFLNLFFGGKLKTMPPKLVSDDGKHVVIRPLAYVRERDLAAYAELQAVPAHPVHAVRLAGEPAAQAGRRDAARVGAQASRAASTRSSTRSARSSTTHLLDRTLQDFAAVRATGRAGGRRRHRLRRRRRPGARRRPRRRGSRDPRRRRAGVARPQRRPSGRSAAAERHADDGRYFTVFWSCPNRILRSSSVRIAARRRIDLLRERVGALHRGTRADRRLPALEVREVLDVLPLALRAAPTDSTPCRRCV